MDALQKLEITIQEVQHLRTKQEHQKKILATLQKKSDEGQLNPTLAGKILIVNQQVKELAEPILHIHRLQWDFEKNLILHLHIQGYFQPLYLFIDSLSHQVPSLSLYQLQINRIDDEQDAGSIECEMILQLQKDIT
ncbi:hypothetical protein [Rodentibacter caecimuris]